MRVEILKPFTCSREDGSIDLKAGMEAFITGDGLLRALETGGYIKILEAKETPVEAPAPDKAPAVNPLHALDALDALEEVGDAPEGLTVKHIGRGRYAVHKGDERVTEGMSKEDAEAALARMV